MSIFFIAAIIGLLLPAISLFIVSKDKPARAYVAIYLILQLAQIATERMLAFYSLRHAIKYTALVFVIARLYQLWVARLKLKSVTSQYQFASRVVLLGTYFLNVGFWIFIVFRLCVRIGNDLGLV